MQGGRERDIALFSAPNRIAHRFQDIVAGRTRYSASKWLAPICPTIMPVIRKP